MDQSTLRGIAYYEFSQGHSGRVANMCSAFNANVVHHSTVTRWYQRFLSDDTSFENEARSGRKSTVEDESTANSYKGLIRRQEK